MLGSITIIMVTLLGIQGGSIEGDNGAYIANWSVENSEVIYVDITAHTTGYLGFGIGPFSNMTGADLFICGWSKENQTSYGWDMHGVGNIPPVMDVENNYEMISASENETHTTVRFSRPLITTDNAEDVDITNSLQYVLWSFGEIDELYHHMRRGVVHVNLMD